MAAPDSGGYCEVLDCLKRARRNGRCWGHQKRHQRGKVVSTALRRRPASSWERLTEAAIDYAGAEDLEDDYERAADRLRKSALAYKGEEDAHCACCRRTAQGRRRPPRMRHRKEQLELF